MTRGSLLLCHLPLQSFYNLIILGYLKDSNAAVHSVDHSDIFYAVIHLRTFQDLHEPLFLKVVSNYGLRAPFPPQMILRPSSGSVYLAHWNPREKRRRYDILVLFVAQCSLVKSDAAQSG